MAARRGRFDPQPVLRYVSVQFDCDDKFDVAELLGVSYRQVMRYQRGECALHVHQADRIATALGRHPVEFWDDWFEEREVH